MNNNINEKLYCIIYIDYIDMIIISMCSIANR